MSGLFVSKYKYTYKPCRSLQTCTVHESQSSSCRSYLVCLVVNSMSYHTHSCCCYRSHMHTLGRFVKSVSRCRVGWTPALGTNRGPLFHAGPPMSYITQWPQISVFIAELLSCLIHSISDTLDCKRLCFLDYSIWMQACLWRSLFFIHCTHSLSWAAPCASCSSKNLQPWTTPFVKEQLPLSLASVSLAFAHQNIKTLWPGLERDKDPSD